MEGSIYMEDCAGINHTTTYSFIFPLRLYFSFFALFFAYYFLLLIVILVLLVIYIQEILALVINFAFIELSSVTLLPSYVTFIHPFHNHALSMFCLCYFSWFT